MIDSKFDKFINEQPKRQINKTICIMAVEKSLDDKINEICKIHNMDRDFFVTKALENQVAMTSQSPKLVSKINKLCGDNHMSRIFFFTKALENYCKYLEEKKKKAEE